MCRFWLLASNAAWIAWGVHTGARALIVLQLGLAAMNVRGPRKPGRTPTLPDQTCWLAPVVMPSLSKSARSFSTSGLPVVSSFSP